jgi:hypothetical protein
MSTIQLLPAENEPIELDPNTGVTILPPSTDNSTAQFLEVETTTTIPLPGAEANRINSMSDVDITELGDGSVLVYSNDTSKWVATTKLEKQLMNGGFF